METRTVEGVPIRVATPVTLCEMKRATVRPIDRADADALLRRPAGDSLPDRIRAVWRRATRLAPGAPVRGVHRYASIEAAQAARTEALVLQDRARRNRTD